MEHDESAIKPGMWCDADMAAMKARIAELEAERNSAHRTIAELSRRPTLAYVQELEAEIAHLKGAANKPASPAPTFPFNAIRHSR